jgi:hypothetical protein
LLVKFFKKGPEKCSICGYEKEIYKYVKSGLTKMSYCKECYDEYYKRIEDRVKAQVAEKIKAGQLVSMTDALDITKKISNEIEAEYKSKGVECK